MAEALKLHYGAEIPRRIAAMIGQVYPSFPARRFLNAALSGYDDLSLMARGRHLADALAQALPKDFEAAADILLKSVDVRLAEESASPMASFLYLPHTLFVAHYGLDHFETAMQAQHLLTQRFTAEFSMRSFLQHRREATLARLAVWTQDPSEHVRRLVSESVRPRLPWAPRLRDFQADPEPVLRLLDALKDDSSLYVRRSVANCLTDIGKDNPDAMFATLRRWSHEAPPERRWLIRHALRFAIKRGDAEALHLMGYGEAVRVAVSSGSIQPKRASIGESVTIGADISNMGTRLARVLVDLRIHYVKAKGTSRPKVFKLTELQLPPASTERVVKRISLAQMTTRTHYPGKHVVDLLINGVVFPVGEFRLG